MQVTSKISKKSKISDILYIEKVKIIDEKLGLWEEGISKWAGLPPEVNAEN